MAAKRKRNSFRKELKLIVIVTVLVLIVCIPSMIKNKSFANQQRQEIELLRSKIGDEESRKLNLQEQKKYEKTDEYLEKVAREMLGLVKENDIIIKPDK